MASSSSSSSSSKTLTLISSDGHEFQVAEGAAVLSITLKNMVENDCANNPIPIREIDGKTLSKVIVYLRKHSDGDGVSDEEKKAFDRDFLAAEAMNELIDLIQAANALDIKGLLDIVAQKIADFIKTKPDAWIRKAFGIEKEVEVEVEKVEVEEEVEVEEVKEESVEKVHKWLFKEEEDMTWETYRHCSNWNTIERSILMTTIHNFAKANRPKDYWKVRTWMNLSDTYNEMAVRTNQIKRSYHEIIGGGKYLQSLFTIERQRHFHENTPVDQILLDIFEPCNECRNRIPVFPKSLLYNGSNPSTSFGSRTDSSSHSKKQWTPDELELLKSTISDFSSASMPKPYWDVQLWTNLSETYNVQARFKNLNTVSYLEFISGGMQLQSIFCEERLSYALHGYGSRGRDFVLMKIFEPCLECRKRIPVFPNGLPNNGSTSSACSIQSHFTSYEDESYYATLNNMLIVVREMFEKGLLTSAQLSIVTFKLHDFARTETWKICLLNNIFTLEMKREILIQSISPEA